MLSIVIFSFNRALQLDYLVRSIISRFREVDYKIVIIYHTTGEHSEGYYRIKEKYQQNRQIRFLERIRQPINLFSYLKTFYCVANVKRYLVYSYLRNKNADNFKSLLERLLQSTDSEFVMFCTDDGVFFDDVYLDDDVLNLIRINPLQTSYRLYVGENLNEFPQYIKRRIGQSYIWNYYETGETQLTHWTYPFAVDGTIYHTKSILSIIKKIPYHNPVTLESYGVSYVMKEKLLRIGIGPNTSRLVCTKLNRVSTCSDNPAIQISTEFLNQKFIDGFELDLELPDKITNANIVPGRVFLIKNGKKSLIYELDSYGKQVQGALGIEGTKHKV